MVRSPGRTAGMFAAIPGIDLNIARNKATNITVTIGDLTHVNTGTSPASWRTTPASASVEGPFGMSTKTSLAADAEAKARIVTNAVCYIIADSSIGVNASVQAATATVGQVIALSRGDVTATPSESTIETAISDRYRQVGVCLGTADTWDTGTPLAAVDGDLVAVWIPLGGY